MKNVRFALLVFSALVMVAALLLLLWANWTPHHTTKTTKLHLIAPEEWGDVMANQVSDVFFSEVFTSPAIIKTGQIARYLLHIEDLPSTILVNGEIKHIQVRSELILPGLSNLQEGMFIQNVQDQKPVQFEWNVRANDPQYAEGILRLYVDYLSQTNVIQSQLISATEVHLRSYNLLGLSTRTASSLAVALVLIAGMAGGLGLTRPMSA
jgi:hypothetical protein